MVYVFHSEAAKLITLLGLEKAVIRKANKKIKKLKSTVDEALRVAYSEGREDGKREAELNGRRED